MGPFILCTIVIVAVLLFLNLMNVPFKEKELFIATVVYAFIFAQIIASGFKMIITRYISDMLYDEKFQVYPSVALWFAEHSYHYCRGNRYSFLL